MLKADIIKENNTFKKEEKLKSRKVIEQLFKEGRSFSIKPFKVLYKFSETGAAPLQAGFAVSTKIFKKAVDRNRIKRLMREGFRLQKNDLKNNLKNENKFLSVFFIYTGNIMPEYQLVFEKMQSSLKRLNKIVDETSAANT